MQRILIYFLTVCFI